MATPQPVVPIGASFAQFLSSGPKPPFDEQISTTIVPPPRIRLPCLLAPDDSQSFQSMVLNGPKNSGKTSMAMNLALSFATSLDCACIDKVACRCTAAIIFRSSADRDDNFPSACERFSSTDIRSDVALGFSEFRNSRVGSSKCVHNNIFQRVRIVYVDSAADIISELLSVLKTEQTSTRCIIIDDIDEISKCSSNPSSAILQTIAVALEASHATKALSAVKPPLLFTTTTAIFAPWIEATISLRLERNPPSWQRNFDVPISHWRATVPSNSSNALETRFYVDYLFAGRPTGDVRIYWRTA